MHPNPPVIANPRAASYLSVSPVRVATRQPEEKYGPNRNSVLCSLAVLSLFSKDAFAIRAATAAVPGYATITEK